jgi:hypothetical protein
MVLVVSDPGDFGDFVDLAFKPLKIRVVKFCKKSPLKLGLVEVNARHAGAHIDLGHGKSPVAWAMAYIEAFSTGNDEGVTGA